MSATANPHQAREPEPLRGKVLYIEDQPVAYEVVALFLGAHPQLQLIHATTGCAGIDLARREAPDVILLDMHLPDISGIEVVRRLSEDIAARRFRVLLLTGDSLNIDVLKAMSLGAFEYLVKPVQRSLLDGAMRRALVAHAAHLAGHSSL